MRSTTAAGSRPGSVRTSTSSRQLSGTMLTLTPPAIGPMPRLEWGTANASSRSSPLISSCSASSSAIRRPAYATALTPLAATLECAALPVRTMRTAALPLCAVATRRRRRLAHEHAQPGGAASARERVEQRRHAGAAELLVARDARGGRVPAARAASTVASAASMHARKPFMSVVPRPYRRSVRLRQRERVARPRLPFDGDDVTVCRPAAGRPPLGAGRAPRAGCGRPARAPGSSETRAPSASSRPARNETSSRFGSPAIVGNATRRASTSTTASATRMAQSRNLARRDGRAGSGRRTRSSRRVGREAASTATPRIIGRGAPAIGTVRSRRPSSA